MNVDAGPQCFSENVQREDSCPQTLIQELVNSEDSCPQTLIQELVNSPKSPVQQLYNAHIMQFAFPQHGFPSENKTLEIEECPALEGEDDLPLSDLPPRFWNLDFCARLSRNLGLTASSFQNQKAAWHTAWTVELPNLLVFEKSAQCSVFEESVESVQFDGSTL